MTAKTSETCAEMRLDLPWLVNGTLQGEAAARLRAHLETCSDCAAAFEAERRLAENVAALSAAEARRSASWARLEAEIAPRPPAPSRLARWTRGRRAAWPAAAAAAAAIALLVASPPSPTEDFETLTDPRAAAEGATVEIRVLPARGADVAAVSAKMAALKLVGVEGPSEGGLLRGYASPSQVAEALSALSDDPGVALAVVDDEAR